MNQNDNLPNRIDDEDAGADYYRCRAERHYEDIGKLALLLSGLLAVVALIAVYRWIGS